MPQLLVIIASTRPGRVGLPVGQWFADYARQHSTFDVRMADLKELDLPLFNEPKHPMLGDYVHDHTKQWSAMVDAADAYAFVMPEYNFAMTAPLKNAIDYLAREWHYKPAGIVSYGGVSGGLRAAQMAKQVLTTLKVMPIPEAVVIPFVAQHIQDGAFKPNQWMTESAQRMLDELEHWDSGLRTLRKK